MNYTLVPGVGQEFGLVQIGDLPSKLPPPDLNKDVNDQGPEWKQLTDVWAQITAYHGWGNPGQAWCWECDLFDQFRGNKPSDKHGMWSGIYLFVKDYKKLGDDAHTTALTDKEIRENMWDYLRGDRMHVQLTNWRVWK